MLANILDGIMNAISMGSLLANLMGVTLGIIFGALPGLTAAMGVALLIPLTFGMPAVEAFSALLGMYVGAIYGGCITAILVGTPGTVSAAATMLEGPALTARGESRRALDMATIASFVGGIVSALALIFIAPMLARAAHVLRRSRIFRGGRVRPYRGGLAVVRASHQRVISALAWPVPRHYRPRSRNGGHAQYLRQPQSSSTDCLWFPCLSAYSPYLKYS